MDQPWDMREQRLPTTARWTEKTWCEKVSKTGPIERRSTVSRLAPPTDPVEIQRSPDL
jgi:hypothetical protein